MKKTIFLFALIFSSAAFAQTFEISKIDSIKLKKDLLFGYSKAWISNTFKSGEAVIDMEDKDTGKVIGKALMTKRVNSVFGNQVGLDIISFNITIDVKDEKYRIVLNNYKHNYLQQASTYIPGNYLVSTMSATIASSRNGGSLDNDKPDCGGMVMTKKQWQDIKNYALEVSKITIDNYREFIVKMTNDSF